MRSTIERQIHDAYFTSGTIIRVSKQRKESEAVLQKLSHLTEEAKKRQVPTHKEPNISNDTEYPYPNIFLLIEALRMGHFQVVLGLRMLAEKADIKTDRWAWPGGLNPYTMLSMKGGEASLRRNNNKEKII
ncbi:hypothetical protein GGR51DRAFT_565785 [Nemania sp. FL0031]|nr:hypothetical protein GGR51DRAFT_565785 [Nemania sp. FL0031]